MIYRLTWFFCQLLFRTFLPRTVVGAENVPASGPVILASNHLSMVDPPAVATSVWRHCVSMAKEELFEKPLIGWYLRKIGAFPVKRGTADRSALKHTLDALEQGKALLMFPEGTRSETGELREPELGVAMIAYRSGAPVVPVYVWGTDNAMPKGKGLRSAAIGIQFGEPLRFTLPGGAKAGRAEYEQAARDIMSAIAGLRESRR